MVRKITFYLLVCLGMVLDISAQEKVKVKYGDVSVKDFAPKMYPIDSNASAVVIADIGYCSLDGNTKGWFSVINKHYKRVHILNKNGYEIADISIPLYSNDGNDEKLDKLRAATYNLENGKVTVTRLDIKNAVFDEQIDKSRKIKKFTFPNIKEGSIIEFEYTTISDFINNPDPWEFQDSYPRLWTEFNFSVPSFFNYAFLKHGYLKYDISTRNDGAVTYNVTVPNGVGPTEHLRVTAGLSEYRWVIKNVPALKEENFTSTINNHIQKLEFQLVEQREPLSNHRYIESWQQVTSMLMEADYFGLQVTKDNGWLKDIIHPIVNPTDNKKNKAQKIFAWIRDNLSCTDYHRSTMDQTLKSLVKTRKGSVAEINLLLTAMLRHEGIEAAPVLLSTRSHGKTYSLYPLLHQYDYVITMMKNDRDTIFLDAAEPNLGFGYLPIRCYNGDARIINEEADFIELNSDDLTEVKNTTVFIINDANGNLVGSMHQIPGYYESDELRERIKERGREELQKDIKKEFGAEIVISNFSVDSLNKYDFPVSMHYDFDIKDEKEDIIYLNPLFGESYKENPFKSAERKYPVELPYSMDETYSLQMEVPHGYVVDEIPSSVILKLNEQGEGLFDYRISQSGDNISLRTRLIIKRTNFLSEEYQMLREFFNLVVKKQGEQIVFKKKQ